MTSETIAELRRLEAAATLGPWEASDGTSHGRHKFMYDVVCPAGDEHRVLLQLNWNFRENLEGDRAFIAAARNAMPALLDAAEQLARIEQAAKADADDLAKMRDGTKLTRAGLVQIIAYQQEDIKSLTAERDEAIQDAEHYSSLYDNLKGKLPDEHDVNSPEDAVGHLCSMCELLDKAGVPSEDYPAVGINPTARLSLVVGERDELRRQVEKIRGSWKRLKGFATCVSDANRARIEIAYQTLDKAQDAYQAMHEITKALSPSPTGGAE